MPLQESVSLKQNQWQWQSLRFQLYYLFKLAIQATFDSQIPFSILPQVFPLLPRKPITKCSYTPTMQQTNSTISQRKQTQIQRGTAQTQGGASKRQESRNPNIALSNARHQTASFTQATASFLAAATPIPVAQTTNQKVINSQTSEEISNKVSSKATTPINMKKSNIIKNVASDLNPQRGLQNQGLSTPKSANKTTGSNPLQEAHQQYQYAQKKQFQEIHTQLEKKKEINQRKSLKGGDTGNTQLKDYRKGCGSCKEVPKEPSEQKLLNKYLFQEATDDNSHLSSHNNEFKPPKGQHSCQYRSELSQLKVELMSEQKMREFYQKQLNDLQQSLAQSSEDPHQEYMQQFKQMQNLIKDKNQQIQELQQSTKHFSNLVDNYKFLRVLNKEYFSLEIGDGSQAFSEKQKIEIESSYINYKQPSKKDRGVQVSTESGTVHANLQESLNMENDLQSLVHENEVLRQRLYARTLDEKSLDFKIDTIKTSLGSSLEQRNRQKATFIESLSDFVFKLHNLGTSDVKKEVEFIVKILFKNLKVFDLMNEQEMIEWIWRLYSNMVAVTGLKGRPPKKDVVNENSMLSANESLNQHACGNSSTMISSKEHQKSFIKELNSPSPLKREAEEDRNLLMQVLNLQAHALEQHLTNESYI